MTVQTKTLELRSPAFEPNGTIPKKHTGEGDDISPELKWGEPPQGTKSFALNG